MFKQIINLENKSNNPLSKNKITLTLVFAIFIYSIAIIGSTYAYISISANNNQVSGQGGCFQVSYTGQELNAGNINSTIEFNTSETGTIANTTVTLSKASTCKIYTEANIYLHTNDATTAPIDTTPAMRYKLVTEDNIEYSDIVHKSCDVLLATVPITDTATTYSIYLWIDANMSSGFYDGKSYSGYVYAESMQTSTIENQDALPDSEKCPGDTDKYVGFSYIGREQTYIIPETGTYELETWGAQGGTATYNNVTYEGGNGGYARSVLDLTKGDVIHIYVGEEGGSATGSGSTGSGNGKTGYNGGGYGNFYANNSAGGGGGGATHIATATGLLKNLSSNTSSILVVAGGGGGGRSHKSQPNYSGKGGVGGGTTGGAGRNASEKCYNIGLGGTQQAVGGHQICSSDGREYGGSTPPTEAAFGLGANYTSYRSASYAGGGGGYYGGAAGYHAPGGGGSSYNVGGNTISGDADMPTYEGTGTKVGNRGNGYAKIKFAGTVLG